MQRTEHREPARRSPPEPVHVPTPEGSNLVSTVEALHNQVGNAAVARLMQRRDIVPLQRDADGGGMSLRMRRPSSGQTLTPSRVLRPGPILPPPVPAAVRSRIEAWLDRHKVGILIQKDAGAISMPEVVAQIRDQVPGAASVDAYQVEQLARAQLGHAAPPQTRGRQTPQGRVSELEALIKNVTAIAGKKVRVGTDSANLVVSISGAVAKVKGPGVTAEASAGPGGVEGSVSVGGRVTATAGMDSFGLKAKIPLPGAEGVFAAKLGKAGDTWSKWSVSFSFPIVGGKPIDARPAADAIQRSVAEAEQAFREIAAHLHQGGSPTDSFVTERAGKLSPAISSVGKAVKQQKGPNVSVRLGAEGGPREVAGERVQAATVGVSLVIEF